MARRKKLFPCGHHGYGQICHRCAQNTAAREAKQEEKRAWELTFAQDPIDLRSLPRNVVLKARQILQGLANHRDYREFHGKRLRHDRDVISIPVTRNYRLLCRNDGKWLVPEVVISHEDYNICKPGH